MYRKIKMRVDYINNNVSSNGLFSKIGQMFEKSHSATLTEKAEQRLQSRLVDYSNTVMRDFSTDLYMNMKTGKKFTGKFLVDADILEHLYDIREGKLKGELVRLKGGKKLWAVISGKLKYGYEKIFNTGLNEHENIAQYMAMCDADKLAAERMYDNFVINQLFTSGKDSIMLSK